MVRLENSEEKLNIVVWLKSLVSSNLMNDLMALMSAILGVLWVGERVNTAVTIALQLG